MDSNDIILDIAVFRQPIVLLALLKELHQEIAHDIAPASVVEPAVDAVLDAVFDHGPTQVLQVVLHGVGDWVAVEHYVVCLHVEVVFGQHRF